MDPFSLSCSIVGVLTAAGQLLSAAYSYGNAVKDFPKDLRELVEELSSLSGILHALKAIMDPPESSNATIAAPRADPSGVARAMAVPVETCGKMLADMMENLERYQTAGSRVQRVVKRLTWPMKESETKGWIEKIGRYKSTFTFAISANGLALTRMIHNDLEEIKNLQATENKKSKIAQKQKLLSEILIWVSPADPTTNHFASCKLQQAGTGRWFTEGKFFQDWLQRKNRFLWLHGIPGAGKTILSSLIIDRTMFEMKTKEKDTIIAYFYFDFKETVKQTLLGFMGSIIAQLMREKPQTLEVLESLYKDSNHGKQPPDRWLLQQNLHEIIKKFQRVIIVMDALDECTERPDLFRVVEQLRRLDNLSVLITSRNELDIKLQFANLPSLSIKKDDVSADIENFVNNEIQRQPKLALLKPTTKEDITATLVKGANGMFRWAKCCLDQIAKLRNDKAIKNALKSLPPTLDKTYERILCAISEEDRLMAIRVFQWLLFSTRPMKLMEVVDGIAVEIEDESKNPDNVLNEPGDILDICGGLVELDESTFTLGLAHFTVKEYLISTDIIQSSASSYHFKNEVSQAELAKVCLTYIMFDDFDDGPCDDYEIQREEYPFLGYAVLCWPIHISRYVHGNDKILDQLILKFFRLGQDSGKFTSWRNLYDMMDFKTATVINTRPPRWKPATLIYFAAEMGQLQAARELLELGADVNAEGGKSSSPLLAAIRGGHEEVLRLLLENGAEKNEEPRQDSKLNPLNTAAKTGQAQCVQILLDFGADPERFEVPSISNPLTAAGWKGYGSVFEVLIEADYFKRRGVPRTLEDMFQDLENPFLQAYRLSCMQGFEKPCRILFQRGEDVLLSTPDENYEGDLFLSSLRLAIASGHLKIVKNILQNSKAKAICIRDGIFKILLQEAAYSGWDKIVGFLLGLRETVGHKNMGLSLHIAAANGNVDIIERLLRAGADPHNKDNDGWSPALYASEYHNYPALERLSRVVDIPECLAMVNKSGPICWDKTPLLEFSMDGLELKNIRSDPDSAVARAICPNPPLCVTYSFEVEIIKESRMAIGFADMLFRYSVNGSEVLERPPGMFGKSWGYDYCGGIMLDDEMDAQLVRRYVAGDIVGCHFDRKNEVAFFTVNGEIVGKPIAEIKGKILAMVAIGPGGHIRTNLGNRPLAHGFPDLSPEILENLWRPSPGAYIGPQRCEPNV